MKREGTMTRLVKYDEACRAIAAARSVDEVKDWHDKSAAMQAYARQAKNRSLEVDAAEIRLRSERRLGELIAEQKATVGLNPGTRTGGTGGSIKAPPAIPTLADARIDKKLSSRAQKLAAVPGEQFEGMLADWRGRVSDETERVTTNLLREGTRASRDEKLVRTGAPPAGQYSLIYADPPWRYEHVRTESRAIENQYPTMGLDDLKAMQVPAADDCVLFLWATSPKLAESMEVLTAWDFTYRTCAVWDKEVIGMGYYFRQQHELLLVATRGTPGTPEEGARPSSVIHGRRAAHSAKPMIVYELLERMYPSAARLELFAREPREGWTGWGNQLAA